MASLIVKICASLVALAAARTQGNGCHLEDEVSFLQQEVNQLRGGTLSATGEDDMEVKHAHEEVDQYDTRQLLQTRDADGLWPPAKEYSCESKWGCDAKDTNGRGCRTICPVASWVQDVNHFITMSRMRNQPNHHFSVLGQNCGKFVELPEGKQNPELAGDDKTERYNFYESTAWVPSMVDSKGAFAYVPATRCYAWWKLHQGYYDDPTCGDQEHTTADIFKVYPGAGRGSFNGPLTSIPKFKAFGSKVTQDGKYLFICDLDHSLIIAIDMQNLGAGNDNDGLAMVAKGVNPNDIAIWEQSTGGAVTLFAAAGSVNTNVYSAVMGVRKNKRTTGEIDFAGCKRASGPHGFLGNPLAAGCDFMRLAGLQTLASQSKATPAGIGVTSPIGASTPDVWIATLGYFGLIQNNGGTSVTKWGLYDPSWGSRYHCTLPGDYTRHNNKGLIDNVVMVDANTMITAIYTDCNQDPAVCLAQNFTSWKVPDMIKASNQMFSKKNVEYNVVAFTRVCLNKVNEYTVTPSDSGFFDIEAISKTFLYPLPADQKGDDVFNGRVTHIQNVGDDLIAINYQFNKVIVFPGVVPEIKCPPERL